MEPGKVIDDRLLFLGIAQGAAVGAFAGGGVGGQHGVEASRGLVPSARESGIRLVARAQPSAEGTRRGIAGVRVVVEKTELVPLAVEPVRNLQTEQRIPFGRGGELRAEVTQVRGSPIVPEARSETRAHGLIAIAAERATQSPLGRCVGADISIADAFLGMARAPPSGRIHVEPQHHDGLRTLGEHAGDLFARERNIQRAVCGEHLLEPNIQLKKTNPLGGEETDIAGRHFFPRPASAGAIAQRIDQGRMGHLINEQSGTTVPQGD